MTYYIDAASRSPIYYQLMQQVREGVARGDLAPGSKLPSVRYLSTELVIAPNTVAKAYSELERDGLIVTRQGLGVFVAPPRNDLTKAAREKRLKETLDKWLTEAVHLGFSMDEVVQLVTKRAKEFHWQAA